MKITELSNRTAVGNIAFRGILVGIILLAASVVFFAQDDTRVSATWQVVKYDITATLPPSDSDRNLSARAKLDLKNVSSRPATTLTLRISPSAEVSAVSINGTATEFTKGEEKVGSGSLQRVVVKMPTVQPGSSLTATVDYKLLVKDNSGVAAISPLGSQFLPLSFWYPTPNSWYFARGADYAPFTINVTAPGSTAISSGTRIPDSRSALSAPIAIESLAAKIAVGRSSSSSSSTAAL